MYIMNGNVAEKNENSEHSAGTRLTCIQCTAMSMNIDLLLNVFFSYQHNSINRFNQYMQLGHL